MINTLIVLAVYILGVYIAFFQLQKWAGHKVGNNDEYQTLFVLSLISWLIFPIYGVVCLIRKAEEEG
jgi:hypothetical protein